MNRRALLRTAPVAMIAGAAAAKGMRTNHTPSPDTPIMALFREWEAVTAAEDAAWERDESEASWGPFAEARRAIEVKMMDHPCERAEDFICKIAAHTVFGVFAMEDSRSAPALWAEARALVAAA